jgi:hypothetical protein
MRTGRALRRMDSAQEDCKCNNIPLWEVRVDSFGLFDRSYVGKDKYTRPGGYCTLRTVRKCKDSRCKLRIVGTRQRIRRIREDTLPCG